MSVSFRPEADIGKRPLPAKSGRLPRLDFGVFEAPKNLGKINLDLVGNPQGP